MSLILLGILNSQAAAAGGAGAYDLLETTELASIASSVTFSGLGSYSDYKHLQIRFTNRSNASSSNDRALIWRFNSDTGSNYHPYHYLRNRATTVEAGYLPTNSYIRMDAGVWAADYSGVYGAGVVDLFDFSDANKYTTTRSLVGNIGDTSYTPMIGLSTGIWMSTAAVTSISIALLSGNDFVAGTRFSLYGIR